MDEQLINIGYRGYARFFNLQEAKSLLPVIKTITHETYAKLDPLRQKLKKMSILDHISPELESEYKQLVQGWIEKMTRLGVNPVTLGVVNFDTGDGYLNWKYPESNLRHFHDYDSDYKVRRSLEKIVSQQSPDWAS